MGKEEKVGKEKKQKLAFLGIGKNQDDEFVALFVDVRKVGESVLSSLKMAWLANASPRSRNGMLPYTEKALKDRINKFKEVGQTENMELFEGALEKLVKEKKNLTQNHDNFMTKLKPAVLK